MPLDLVTTFPVEPGHTRALERFVGECLADAGVWESWRASDGIQCIDRVFERTQERLRLCGRIWSIDQSLHEFWLELAIEAAGQLTWCLYFDVVASSPRRARDAFSSRNRAEDIEWRVFLAGAGATQNGIIAPVPGSMRTIIREAGD